VTSPEEFISTYREKLRGDLNEQAMFQAGVLFALQSLGHEDLAKEVKLCVFKLQTSRST
jgi:hypothetical protein